MFEFDEQLIYTGKLERTSKKTGEIYTIINFLGEDGQTFGAMLDGIVEKGLQQLDQVIARFKIIPGRYNQFKVLKVEKA